MWEGYFFDFISSSESCGSRLKAVLFLYEAGNSCFLGDVCMRRPSSSWSRRKKAVGGWFGIMRLYVRRRETGKFSVGGVDPPRNGLVHGMVRPTNPGPPGPVSCQPVRFSFGPLLAYPKLTYTIGIIHTVNLKNKYVFVQRLI